MTQVQVVNQLSSCVSKERTKPAQPKEPQKPVQPKVQQPAAPKPASQPAPQVQQEQPEPKPAPKSQPDATSNFNEQVLALHQSGATDVEIARTLGRGLGEVKLVIGLYKGEDVSEI